MGTERTVSGFGDAGRRDLGRARRVLLAHVAFGGDGTT